MKYKQYDDLSEYGRSYGEIFKYAPPEAVPLIVEIDECITKPPIFPDKLQRNFDTLCKLLVAELNEDVKPKKRNRHAK